MSVDRYYCFSMDVAWNVNVYNGSVFIYLGHRPLKWVDLCEMCVQHEFV